MLDNRDRQYIQEHKRGGQASTCHRNDAVIAKKTHRRTEILFFTDQGARWMTWERGGERLLQQHCSTAHRAIKRGVNTLPAWDMVDNV